jgi:tetratricopeptide (TPR) repeat protein
MTTKWYKKVTVQAALIGGLAVVLAAIITLFGRSPSSKGVGGSVHVGDINASGKSIVAFTVDQSIKNGPTKEEITEIAQTVIDKYRGENEILRVKRSGTNPDVTMLRQQLINAIERLDETERKGDIKISGGIVGELRKSGDVSRLLDFLIVYRNLNKDNLIEVDKEISAVAYLKGDIELAAKTTNEILAIDPENFEALNKRGDIFRLRGELENAKSTYQSLLKVTNNRANLGYKAVALDKLGLIYMMENNLQDANQVLCESLEINEKLGAKEKIAINLNNLGLVLYYKQLGVTKKKAQEKLDQNPGGGNHAPAIGSISKKTVMEGELLRFVVPMWDADGDALLCAAMNVPSGATFSHGVFKWSPTPEQKGFYLITFYANDGQSTATEMVEIEVVNINRPAANLILMADKKVSADKGIDKSTKESVSQSQFLKQAEEKHYKALRLYEELGDEKGVATTYRYLGTIYAEWGDLNKAEEMQLKALAIHKEQGQLEELGCDYRELADIYLKQRKLIETQEFIEKALKIDIDLGANPAVAMDYFCMARLNAQQGNRDAAKKNGELSRKLYADMNMSHKEKEVKVWMEGLGEY